MILTFSSKTDSANEIDFIQYDGKVKVTTQKGFDKSTYIAFELDSEEVERLKRFLNKLDERN